MRFCAVLHAASLAALFAPSAVQACDPFVAACLPAAVVFPAYTPEGNRIGTIEARIRLPYALERSRFTGQSVPVVYNNPRSLPGSVDPEFRLVPLSQARHFQTQAVYPRGY